jgi:hypothetical protein
MGAMTIGYTAGAALLWLAGLTSMAEWVASLQVGPGFGQPLAAALVVPGAIAWTLVIVAYLAWTFLRRPDEERFLAVLRASYRLPMPATTPEPALAPVDRDGDATASAPTPGPAVPSETAPPSLPSSEDR